MLDEMISADRSHMRLKTLNPTRWSGRRIALNNFTHLFEPLVNCLDAVAHSRDPACSQAGNLKGTLGEARFTISVSILPYNGLAFRFHRAI